MRTCVIYIKSVLAVLVSCLAVSCGGGYGGDGMRTAEETAALAAADDSLSANSPRSLDMLKAGLESADDSLTRCDWYLRMMRYAVQRGMPDTLALRWNEVDAYLARQKRTPRVDGMRGMLLNIKGSHYYKLHYEPGMAIRAYSEAYSLLFGSGHVQLMLEPFDGLIQHRLLFLQTGKIALTALFVTVTLRPVVSTARCFPP